VATTKLEIVKAGFHAFNERGVDGVLPIIDPEFEVTTPPELASEPDTYRGHEGVRRYFDSFYEVMDEIRWEAHSFEEVGAKVIVPYTLHARGKSSGLEFGQNAVMVWELRGDKAIGLEIFETVEEARTAAGEEEGGNPAG